MLRTTLKSLLSHKFRLLTTSLAVLLGVAFMAGTFMLTDTMSRTFDDLFAEVSENTDAVVRSSDSVDLPFGGEQRAGLDESIIDVVDGVEGVETAEGEIEGYAQFVDEEGEPVGNPAAGAPTFGISWPDTDALNPMDLVDGRGPEGAGEVVADKGTADAAGYQVGDRVQLLLSGQEPVELELVGIVRFGSVDSPGGASIALLDFEAAQELLLDGSDEVTRVNVIGEDGVTQEELADRIRNELPADAEAITGEEFIEENQDAIQEGLGFFQTALLVFAGISLFVSCFIIYNTFTIIVAQRTRELALLRALGASRRQVLGSVLIEAGAVGAVAGVLGLVAGMGLANLLKAALDALGIDIPATGLVVLQRTVVVSILVGVGVTMASAILPARRAATVPPVAAMRDISVDRASRSRVRLVIGAGVLLLGVLMLISGLSGNGGNAIITVGIAVGVIFIAVAVLSPIIAAPVTGGLGWPVARLRGITGALARQNAIRNPRRTASTAAALMIGVGLVSFITIFAESAKSAVNDTIDDAFLGDFVISTSSPLGQGGLPPAIAEQIAALPEVDLAAGIRIGLVEIAGEDRVIAGIDPAAGLELFDIGITAGDPLDLGPNGLAVHDELAEERGWTLGSTVPARFLAGGERDLVIETLYAENQLAGNMFLGIEGFEANFDVQADAQVIIRIADGVDPESARAAIEPIVEEHAAAQLQNLEEFKEEQASQINALLNVIYVLLALAVVIALIGIANTLALSIFERTREIGLLRAVGMTRRQVRGAVRWEAVLIALFGTALGLVLGVFFGWAVVRALADEGFRTLVLPGGQLAIVVGVAAVAGVMAAILPARRAARLDVLQAIATD